MCVFVCVAGHQYVWYVQIMRWWSSNLVQLPLRTYALELMLTLIISLPSHLFQQCYGSPFLTPPGPISYRPPIFYPLTPRLSIFVTASLPPPPPYCPGAELPSSWTDPPPAGIHCSSALPSHVGWPKEFLVQACDCLPSSGCSPFDVLDLFPGPCQTQGLSYPIVPSSLYMSPSSARMISPFRPRPASQSHAGP